MGARINTLSQLHRILSRSGSEGAVSLKLHLSEVTDALAAALSSPEQLVRVTHTGRDCLVLMRLVQPIVLNLCEVFINAMKHADLAGVPLMMPVDCALSQDGRLVLSTSDDGVGLPDGFDTGARGGTGFKVMWSLAAEIGAELQIVSTPLDLTCRLPLAAGTMVGTKFTDRVNEQPC